MRLLIAEKPSVAQEIAAVVGADKRHTGYLEGNGWLVSWCYGHLVDLADPSAYDPCPLQMGIGCAAHPAGAVPNGCRTKYKNPV